MGTQSTACASALLAGEIAGVGEDTHEVVEDLVTNDSRHLETLLACNGVDNHIAVDTNEVLGVKNAILILVTVVASAAFTCQFANLGFHTELLCCESESDFSQHCIAQLRLRWGVELM